MKSQIGIVGLAVMGANLAKNIANKGFSITVFNRTFEKTLEFTKQNPEIIGAKNLKELVKNLESPRKIILLVKAGEAVDQMVKELTPLLSKNDTIIDCGNSDFKDTQRRFLELQKKKINFIGCGISGGEEGALNGPSIMPGGSKESYKQVEKIFQKIAAKDFNQKPCVSYIGENGAGHFVKTIHNGIEYGVMQTIAETYDILKTSAKLKNNEIAEIFEKLNKGKLNSYLFEITAKILKQKDDLTKGYLIDKILDKAEQKGTGKLTTISSLERGCATPSITEAVYARIISSEKSLRTDISKHFKKSKTSKTDISFKSLEAGLYASMLIIYAQGYHLISKAAEEEKWTINLGEISRIWEGGCIIRAQILNFLHKAFEKNKKISHLFLLKEIAKDLDENIEELRKIVIIATKNGTPAPSLSSCLNYFDSITQERLPANIIQALRDFFGAHTYERTDKKGHFHTNWN